MSSMSSQYQKATFLLSAAKMKQLPPDSGIEVAIVGRSNAGKSSVLNRITHNKQLARVSKTPGRTQLINVFVLDDERRLIDLPGYGFAKVSIAIKEAWQKNIDAYIQERESLTGLLLIMDIRHPMKPQDVQLLEYCETNNLSVHIILNKADKLSRNLEKKTLQEVTEMVSDCANTVTLQTFSALKKTGIKELQSLLDEWYGYEKGDDKAIPS